MGVTKGEVRLAGFAAAGLLLVNCLSIRAQTPIAAMGPGGGVMMLPTDWSVLETPDPRTDLPCSVDPVKPAVGFDLRFHSGYEVSVPLKELAGDENQLTMIFRVTPESGKEHRFYFSQRIHVPPIAEDAPGNAYLEGLFDLGVGRYHVDWLMRDRSDRICSSYWDLEAELGAKDKPLSVILAPGTAEAAEIEEFKEEPSIERGKDQPPLSVKVLVHFAPQREHSAAFPPEEIATLVSILRGIDREPRIGRFSVIAFNLQEQRVLYSQPYGPGIDFPSLGRALRTLKLGTVDLKRLENKNGETDFLSDLIQQVVGKDDHPDALIFAGPKALVDENVPRDTLKGVGEVEYPVFYLNYNLHPQDVPWRDAIGRAVKFFRGYEFTITRPRDLGAAMADMVAKIVKSRDVRNAASLASH
ncbi:MAG: acetyltransferase [Bryobacteraceae bacterium]|jgi:hypothetical protein